MAITHVVTYSSLPTLDELHARVREAQQRLPLLNAIPEGARTRSPMLVVSEPFDASDIVENCAGVGDATSVLKAELGRMQARKPHEPLWRVGVYPASKGGYLALSCNHVLMDGRGSFRLLSALTASRDDPTSIFALPAEDGKHASYDATVMTAAGLGLLLKSVWREVIIPILPIWLQRVFTGNDPWPGVVDSPLGHEWDILSAGVDADTAARLSKVGKEKGIKTLHPLIKAAYTAAVWAVFHTDEPLHLISNTPRSDRDLAMGHSAITSVYTSLLNLDHEVRGTDDLWTLARTAATFLRSKQADSVARQTFSMLRHLPDPKPKNGVTGWMQYLSDRAHCPAPFFESVMVSNLGRFALPEAATDYIWGQANHPSAYALGASVVGHQAGIRLTTNFWEGVPADSAKIENLHRIWERVVGLMADGTEGTIEEITRKCM